MNLNQTILNECREEVAKEYGMTHAPFEKLQRTLQLTIYAEAALLAMEKQAEFYRSISKDGWVNSSLFVWYHPSKDCYENEEELYNIWREGK